MARFKWHIKGHAPEWIAALAAVGVYCSMYAFRKPFTMLSFEALNYFGVSYKVWLITAQLIGYGISKVWGIKLISSLNSENRFVFLIKIISIAGLSLFLFAIVPPPYTILMMFLNGIPLGLVWGVVFSYLEGRQLTDLMGSLLASSFIFSSGLVKSIGSYFLHLGVSSIWMPFVTGAFFFIPFIALLTVLNRIRPPDKVDLEQRSERVPMNHADRKSMWAQWNVLLIPLIFVYVFYTVLRDYRDNFALEIFEDIKVNSLWLISRTELLISLIILTIMAGFVLIKNHLKAVLLAHWLMIFGFVLLITSSILFQAGWMSGLVWFIVGGLGVFAGYIPFNCVLMDRLVSMIQVKGNAGFLMYIFDSVGYAGTILVLLFKEWIQLPKSESIFYIQLIYVLGIGGMMITIYSMFFHIRLFKMYA